MTRRDDGAAVLEPAEAYEPPRMEAVGNVRDLVAGAQTSGPADADEFEGSMGFKGMS